MEHLLGGAGEVGWIALKALLLYLSAVVGLRFGSRRTLADLSPFDFVAAVAVGAIVGRIPNAHDASYLTGVATLAAVLAGHWCVTRLHASPSVGHLLDPAPRLLVLDARVLERDLAQCGLTHADLYALLRRQGVEDLGEVRFAILEARGQLSVIRRTSGRGDMGNLIQPVAARQARVEPQP
ncbi:DUF421 domain-containing protein [Pararoseomonas indoligenes]|uniref:DUF421 domain-containing protein n=1 Tax=Roseomonas indoligenes TaxID=2820811 RepID=A0A940N9H5_9PROT|nr:YetF domain-containing protein [Pararoseomonas indoligenes]MBP0496492.1 DUF421 domain-containing protein [Pararoseomonas indoligenes]